MTMAAGNPDAYRSAGVLVVDLDALARNYRRLRGVSEESEVAAVVKANAYGLGMPPVARRLIEEGCKKFFVATLQEGIELRETESGVRIYVLEGLAPGSEDAFLEHALTPVLNTVEEVERWATTNRRVALQIDTGMSRLGLSSADVEELAKRSQLLEKLQLEYVMTHLACADDQDHTLNVEQLELFNRLRLKLPTARTSIGNSAGVFLGSAHRGDLVRAGIGLYGGNPFIARPSPVRPVARLLARVLQIRRIDADANVGYGATYTARAGDRLATVGVGYADGYPRQLGNRSAVSFNGLRLPVVGRVSMDLLAVDISGIPEGDMKVGQYVELFGGDISVDEVAKACGTISYEILTGLNKRLERAYVG
jgi:alanine racemase